MQVIPAVDLMNGNVVRLSRGDPATAKAYSQWGTPVQVALKWKAEGAKRLHIIDLDAAFGRGNNLQVIRKIAEAAALPIQVGGGIRTVEAAEKLLTAGISHVILGALAFTEPGAIAKIQGKFGTESVIVALDNKDGKVMVEGWQTATAFTMAKALEKFAQLGVNTFLITSIAKDGMLQGPELEPLREACKRPGVNVIAAGGIGSLYDLALLKCAGAEAAVVGKALYEGRFTLEEALKLFRGN
jgi:phosphoribosylformimino-5-aminoimidazole carboxamide ribotide isomerase